MKLNTALKATATLAVMAVVGLVSQQIIHPTVARAQSTGCSTSALTGSYSYSVTGTYYDNLGYVYAYADVGVVTGDGNGGVTGSDTVSNDGNVAQRTFTGTYTVNSDCTGNVKFNFSGGSDTASMNLAIFNGGKGINLIETDGGVIVSGTATAQ